jgi:pimeloyl-ACP methyl ester carboxylesterase
MIEVSGQPTRVLTLGLEKRTDGEPILFLHAGGGVTLETWAPWLISVSEIAPVVAYDRVGIGGSPFDGLKPSFNCVVTHAHDLLAALDVSPPYVLVGHSIGGVIIFKYATRYPTDVAGLVHLDPTPLRWSPHEWVGASSNEEMEARWAELRHLNSTGAPPGLLAWLEMVDGFLLTPVADRHLPADPDIPTAVLLSTAFGADDEIAWWTETVSRSRSERRVADWTESLGALSHGTLILANDIGHYVFRDAPGLANEAVRRVLGAR